MKAITTYLFNHSHYNEVISTYSIVSKKYISGLRVWAEHENLERKDTFNFKEIVFNNSNKIKDVDEWVKYANRVISKDINTLHALFWNTKGIKLNSYGYDEYKFIFSQKSYINFLEKALCIFYRLKKDNKEALCRHFNKSIEKFDFKDLEQIVESEQDIIETSDILKEAARISNEYPTAWNLYFKGKDISSIDIESLEQIVEEYFDIKECTYDDYLKNKELFYIVTGSKTYDPSAFTKDNYFKENIFYTYIHYNELYEEENLNHDDIKDITYDHTIKDKEKLKKLILGSTLYGEKAKFVESFSIPSFYDLRHQSDNLDLAFDDIILRAKNNEEAIKQFNKQKSGREKMFIQDYIPASTENSDLYKFIELYNKNKEILEKARRISLDNSYAFTSIYGDVDINTCGIEKLLEIIDNEPQIRSKQREHDEKERIRLESEKKERDLRDFRRCVSGWYTHTYNGSVKHKWFVDYYSYRDHKDFADSSMWDTWKFVWHFKNDPNATVAVTNSEHSKAMERAIELVEEELIETFGYDRLSNMTLVCLTASTQLKNELRFKKFAERVCDDLDMYNGYCHIKITEGTIAKHCGGDGITKKSYDIEWFKDKYIVLFDDVRTSGRSLVSEKSMLERMGAHVICAITLAQTTH